MKAPPSTFSSPLLSLWVHPQSVLEVIGLQPVQPTSHRTHGATPVWLPALASDFSVMDSMNKTIDRVNGSKNRAPMAVTTGVQLNLSGFVQGRPVTCEVSVALSSCISSRWAAGDLLLQSISIFSSLKNTVLACVVNWCNRLVLWVSSKLTCKGSSCKDTRK